jgi:DNA-binding GntR family transcriptional regulator
MSDAPATAGRASAAPGDAAPAEEEATPRTETRSLARVSTVDALAGSLRARIVEGELEAGRRLRERELTEEYGVARHSVRAALRALAADGLVKIEPNRGASVALLDEAELAGLYDMRAALELEAVHLALERHGGRLPDEVRGAVAELAAVCRESDPAWGDVADAHNAVHVALVRAGGSERISRAYDALAGEMLLVLRQLKPLWTLDRMASDHEHLVGDIERDGPDALREHLRESRRAISGGD